ncbi:MAG TPA: enoyl-CoA hydratase-related protein [Acidimicrobiales bacterium]|nr:enoyl-CoA hydratase-related protein [Acidimicrobiales bacterium]
MDEPILVTEKTGGVMVLRMNRPEARNALSPDLMAALGRAFKESEEDDEIRCLVLTGTGDRAFCAGMDLRAFSEGTRPSPEDEEAIGYFRQFFGGPGSSLPVIGAAQATAVAGGFELLLACDLVVAADNAQFGVPEVKRGLFAAGGGVYLASRIPLAMALELTLTGDYIDAARAHSLGLVNRVVPAAEVVPTAVALAESIARNGPLALKVTREIVRASAEDMARARSLLVEWQPKVFGSEDAKEGAMAFIERRDPVWKGR